MHNENIDLNIQGDHIVRAIALDGLVRLTAVRSIETTEMARKLHDLSPISTVALGRFMSGLQLLTMDLKNEGDEITGIIKAEGEIKGMTAVAKRHGDIKAYIANTKVPTYFKSENEKKFDLHRAMGNGVLTIIKSMAGAKPYSGSTKLISGEIAEDFTYYMAVSEQVPTIMGLGVLLDQNGVKQAGGYLVQALPGATDEVLDYLEQRVAGFPDVSFLMEEGFTPAQILDLFIGDPDIQYLETLVTRFACDCSEERMLGALQTLGVKDLLEMKEDGKGIEMHCEFCSKHYHFDNQAIDQIIAKRAKTFNIVHIDE